MRTSQATVPDVEGTGLLERPSPLVVENVAIVVGVRVIPSD